MITESNENKSFDKERKKLSKATKLHSYHWAILGLSLFLTLFAWYFTQQQVNNTVRNQFEREANQAVDLISERMKKYEDVLWGGVATIKANKNNISYESWLAYTNNLHIKEKYPGINGIGVIYLVKPDELSNYLTEQTKTRPTFSIHPKHNEDIYLPITYVEPYATNAKAVGLDMAHEKNRYSSALKARDSGLSQITGPITLVQDSGKTPGFLFYAPFYNDINKENVLESRQESFSGLVYAPFVVQKLMEGTLDKEKRQVGIKISDQDSVLYDEHNISESDYDANPLFTKVINVELYGRKWSFDIWSANSFRMAANNNQPTYILVGGIIIDSILLLFFILLTRTNRQAIDFAKLMSYEAENKAEELEESVKHLAQYNEELENFTYVSSHDLKEPLRMIVIYTQMLQERYSENFDDKAKGYMKIICDSGKRMDQLISDLLVYAKIDKDSEPDQAINCEEYINFALSNLGGAISTSQAEITLSNIPEAMTVSPIKFSSVIQNLVSNSIKYQPVNQKPKINICAKDIGEHWEFSISDNGIGFKEKYMEKIFKPFQRLHLKEEYDGTGMGLTITKKAVAGMGGKVWSETEENIGSTFYFTVKK